MLSWNIRGASNPRAQRHLKEMLGRMHPSIIILMETHTVFDNTKIFWERVGYAPVAIVEAQGHSGGLWVLQHTGLSFSISVFYAGDCSITLELSKGQQKWYCTGLYANPNPIQRP